MNTGRFLLGLLLALLVPALGMVAVTALEKSGALAGPAWISGGLAMQAAMLAVSMIFILALTRGRPARYGFRLPSGARVRSAVMYGSAAAVVTHVAVALVWQLLPPGEGHPAMTGGSFLHTVIAVWLVASISEEVLYRGLVQSFLEPLAVHGLRVLGVRLSLPVITAAILFGCMHLMLLAMGAGGTLVTGVVLTATVVGLVAGYHREKSGSLVPAILVHMLFNVYGSASAYIQELAGL